jgi:putative transcriptional regulator
MTIRHHPDDATLMAFAAGTLPQAFAAVVAAHIAMCPRCREELEILNAVGGALIDALPPSSLRPAQHTQPSYDGGTAVMTAPALVAGGLPYPFHRLVGTSFDTVRWRRVAPGIWLHDVELPGETGGTLKLLKASPAATIPEHGHGGHEMTLVLQGAFSDATGTYGIGDVADLDDHIEHTPVADSEIGCICALATEQPPEFKAWWLRLLHPILRM